MEKRNVKLKGYIADYKQYIEKKEEKQRRVILNAKERYNEEHYTKLNYWIEKDLVKKFKKECYKMNVSQASVIKEYMEKFIEGGHELI